MPKNRAIGSDRKKSIDGLPEGERQWAATGAGLFGKCGRYQRPYTSRKYTFKGGFCSKICKHTIYQAYQKWADANNHCRRNRKNQVPELPADVELKPRGTPRVWNSIRQKALKAIDEKRLEGLTQISFTVSSVTQHQPLQGTERFSADG